MIAKTCQYCQRPFESRFRKAKFCSRHCANNHMAQHRIYTRKAHLDGRVVGVQEADHRRIARQTRIDWLGTMNDRRVRCLAERDYQGLLDVAAEYAARGLVHMAALVKAEAG